MWGVRRDDGCSRAWSVSIAGKLHDKIECDLSNDKNGLPRTFNQRGRLLLSEIDSATEDRGCESDDGRSRAGSVSIAAKYAVTGVVARTTRTSPQEPLPTWTLTSMHKQCTGTIMCIGDGSLSSNRYGRGASRPNSSFNFEPPFMTK